MPNTPSPGSKLVRLLPTEVATPKIADDEVSWSRRTSSGAVPYRS